MSLSKEQIEQLTLEAVKNVQALIKTGLTLEQALGVVISTQIAIANMRANVLNYGLMLHIKELQNDARNKTN